MDDDIDGMSLYSSFGFGMPRNAHRVREVLYRDMAHSLGGDVDTDGENHGGGGEVAGEGGTAIRNDEGKRNNDNKRNENAAMTKRNAIIADGFLDISPLRLPTWSGVGDYAHGRRRRVTTAADGGPPGHAKWHRARE